MTAKIQLSSIYLEHLLATDKAGRIKQSSMDIQRKPLEDGSYSDTIYGTFTFEIHAPVEDET